MHHNLPPEGPEFSSLRQFEIAGALQAVYAHLPSRDFIPDTQQEEGIQALGEALISGKTRGYIEMATGTGKTMLEVLAAEATANAGHRTVLLAPSIEIADQIYGEDGDTGFGRFTNLLGTGKVRRHYGGRRANANSPIVIMTYQGLIEEMKNPKLGAFDMIVADECHMSLGPQTTKAVTEYMPRANRFGFSATPDYAEDRKSAEVYGERLFEFSLLTAIESGKTAPVRALLYETGKTLRLTDNRRDFTDAELAPLTQEADRNGTALRLATDLVADGRQGIIACIPGENNAHARVMAHALSQATVNDRKIIAKDVGAHLPREEQKQRLKDYKEGKIDVLTFTKSLEQGWDSDRASFCLNLSPTTSEVRIKQILGRILRRKPDGKEAIFIDFIDKKFGLNKMQYTAMHALEIEDIDVHRMLGRPSTTRNGRRRELSELPDISTFFHPELYAQLLKGQGKLLREVLIAAAENPNDPLIAEWDRRLLREKPPMPGELPYNPALNHQTERKLFRIATGITRDTGQTPTDYEILQAYGDKNLLLPYGYGRREEWEDDTLASIVEEGELSDPEEYVARLALRGTIFKILETLSEREAGVLRLHTGLADGNARTFDEIGQVYGVSRERVRQILSKVRSEIREPKHAKEFVGYVPFPRRKAERHASMTTDIFDAITVPVFDAKDQRPYNMRLEEACNRWLDQSKRRANVNDPVTLRGVTHLTLPDAVRAHGQVLHTREAVIEHFNHAIYRLNRLETTLAKHPYTTLGNALENGLINHDELRYLYGIHSEDPEHIQLYIDISKGTMLRGLEYLTVDRFREFTASLRALDGGIDNFMRTEAKSLHRLYNRARLGGIIAEQNRRTYAGKVQELKMVRKRVEQRPNQSSASRAASLAVIDTQLYYYGQFLVTPPTQTADDDEYVTLLY